MGFQDFGLLAVAGGLGLRDDRLPCSPLSDGFSPASFDLDTGGSLLVKLDGLGVRV